MHYPTIETDESQMRDRISMGARIYAYARIHLQHKTESPVVEI